MCRVYPLITEDQEDTVSLLTREPNVNRPDRVTVQDLVSHRTSGVDNTGNICVWDSEQTLAYLLYQQDTLASLIVPESICNVTRIVELGTGMAGMSALALGLRLSRDCGRSIRILLTDGHADGVKNNLVNDRLTQAYSRAVSSSDASYEKLHVDSEKLLWTTEYELNQIGNGSFQVCLVSDCVHFQQFHAALAITAVRLLSVGGRVIFCQPSRADSLDRFFQMLQQVAGSESSPPSPLLRLTWWTHGILDAEHDKASTEYPGVYEESLHRPRILMLDKLRELTTEDCQCLIDCHAMQRSDKK